MNPSLSYSELDAGKAVRKYQGMMAWPIVLLAAISIVSFITVCALGVSEKIPLGIGLILNILLLYVLFTPLHEACHKNIAGKQRQCMWVNHLVGFFAGVFLLFDYRALQRLHLTHHRNTNDELLDPDQWVKVNNLSVLIIRCFTIVPYYFWYFFRHVVMKPSKPGNLSLSLYVICMYTALFCLIYFIGSAGYWVEVLTLWIGPHWIASALIIFLFAYIPHKSCHTNDRYLNTRIHSIGGQWEWLSNAIHLYQNYHLIHHLFPRIPFYLYPSVFGELREFIIQKGARVEERLGETQIANE